MSEEKICPVCGKRTGRYEFCSPACHAADLREKKRLQRQRWGRNRERQREYTRARYRAHPERFLEYEARWRKENPEKYLAWKQRRRQRSQARAAIRDWICGLSAVFQHIKEVSMSKTPDLQEKLSPKVEALFREYAPLTPDELKIAFDAAYANLKTRLMEASVLHSLLEKNGVKVSLNVKLRSLMREVAAGKINPDIIVRFDGEPLVIKEILSLPAAQQQELLKQPDDEIRKATKEMADARGKKAQDAPSKRPARHNVTQAEHAELQRKYDLLAVEAAQLRERVAELRQALDALTQRKSVA